MPDALEASTPWLANITVFLKQAVTWNLGPFAVILVPEQMSPGETKYKEIIRD